MIAPPFDRLQTPAADYPGSSSHRGEGRGGGRRGEIIGRTLLWVRMRRTRRDEIGALLQFRMR